MRQTAQEYPVGGEVDRSQFHVCLEEEAVRGQRYLEHLRDLLGVLGRDDRRREHHGVRFEQDVPVEDRIVGADRDAGLRRLEPRFGLGLVADEPDPRRARLCVQLLLQAVRSDVPVEHRHLRPGHALHGSQCVLHRLRAADAAAVRVLLVAAPDALDHHDPLSDVLTVVEPRLVFELRDDPRVGAVEVLRRLVRPAADRHDRGPVLDRRRAAVGLEGRREATDRSLDRRQPGRRVHRDVRVRHRPFDQVVEPVLR